MTFLFRAIQDTLEYSDRFSFPLRFEEIHLRLVGRVATKTELRQALKKLLDLKKIGFYKDFYFLPGRKYLVETREQSFVKSTSLLHKAQKKIRILQNFPGILAIYLTGSLSVMNSKEGDDIDLMIITYNHRLWLTRALITIYLSLLRIRRTPGNSKFSGKLCLNLYLTPASLKIPKDKHSLYTAFELIQTQPLFDPYNIHTLLLGCNTWIYDYLPNYPRLNPQSVSKLPLQSSNKLLDLLEKLAYRLQYAYMRSKITREYITPQSAYFHPTTPEFRSP